MANDEYNSVEFDAEMNKAEALMQQVKDLVGSKAFMDYVDCTQINFSNTKGLIVQHENVLFKILEAKTALEAFCERVRGIE